METIIKFFITSFLVLFLPDLAFCQCKCKSLQVVSFKNADVKSSQHFAKVELETTSKNSRCLNDYADFWIVSDSGDTLNEDTKSAMRIPNRKAFKGVINVITLKSKYDSIPTHFSGRLIIVSENCNIPIKID